jgi:hypothetical protein
MGAEDVGGGAAEVFFVTIVILIFCFSPRGEETAVETESVTLGFAGLGC